MVAGVAVAEVVSEADRDAVASLRYRVFCDELGLALDIADHAARRLHVHLDDEATLLLARLDDEVLGTLRILPGRVARGSDADIECFKLDRLDDVLSPDDYIVVDRFVVDPEHRSGSMAPSLMMAAAAKGLELQVKAAFANCEPHLLPMYLRFGFVPYTSLYNHPSMGVRIPLVLLADRGHLSDNGSALGRMLPDDYPAVDSSAVLAAAAPGTALPRPIEQRDLHHRFAVFEGLSEDDVRDVIPRGCVMPFSVGDAPVCQGHASQTVYLVVDGGFTVMRDGQEIAELAPGDTFGEGAFISGGQRSADVIASSAATAIALDQATLRRLLRRDDDSARTLRDNLTALASARGLRDLAAPIPPPGQPSVVDYDAPLGTFARAWMGLVALWNVARCVYAHVELELDVVPLVAFAVMAFGFTIPYGRATSRLARVVSGRARADSSKMWRDVGAIVFIVVVPYVLLVVAANELGASQVIGIIVQLVIIAAMLGLTLIPQRSAQPTPDSGVS